MCFLQVIAEGEQSLYGSEIRGISSLAVNWNEAMSTSNVTSKVVYGNIFVARINGTNNESYYIYCTSTDICKIYCQSSNACTKLFLYCFGTCYVACDEDNGIDCPFAGDYSDLTTSSPTTTPNDGTSGYPTTITTVSPSSEPTTEEPTLRSTRQLTDITTLVTLIPNINPSINPSMSVTSRSTRHPASHTSAYPTSQPTPHSIETPLGVKQQVLLVVIVTSGIVLLICMISLFVCSHKRSKKIKEQHEVEMKEILQKAVAALSLKNKTSDPGATSGQQQKKNAESDISGRTKGQSIDLQRTKSGGDINEYNNQNMYQDEGTCVGAVGDATDLDTEIVFSDDEGDEVDQTTGKDSNPNQDQ